MRYTHKYIWCTHQYVFIYNVHTCMSLYIMSISICLCILCTHQCMSLHVVHKLEYVFYMMWTSVYAFIYEVHISIWCVYQYIFYIFFTREVFSPINSWKYLKSFHRKRHLLQSQIFLHLSYICLILVLLLSYICLTFILYLSYICLIFVLHLSCQLHLYNIYTPTAPS